MTIDLFASAPTAPAKETKKAAKDKKPQVEIGNDLDVLAAADAVSKTLKTVQEVYGTRVKGEMSKHFAQEGIALHRRPENFRGVGFKSTASCEFRKRDERRALAVEEVAVIEAAGGKVEEKVMQEEAFFFNNDILANPELRAKVSAALGLIDFGGLSPLIKQERIVSKVVTEETMEMVFANAKSEEETVTLTTIIGTMAIKPTFSGSLADAMKVLDDAGVKL